MSPCCCCRSCPVSTAVRTALYTAQHSRGGATLLWTPVNIRPRQGSMIHPWPSQSRDIHPCTLLGLSRQKVEGYSFRRFRAKNPGHEVWCDVTCDLQNRTWARRGETELCHGKFYRTAISSDIESWCPCSVPSLVVTLGLQWCDDGCMKLIVSFWMLVFATSSVVELKNVHKFDWCRKSEVFIIYFLKSSSIECWRRTFKES